MRLSRQRSILQRSRGNPKARAEGLDGVAIEAIFKELEAEVRESFRRYGITDSTQQHLVRSASMRYARQVHEVRIPVDGSLGQPQSMERLVAAFDAIYEQRYGKGTGSRSAVIEITNCQLQLVQVLPKVTLAEKDPGGSLAASGRRRVYQESWLDVPVYRWHELPFGSSFAGPALVDAPGTTVWVAPEHTVQVDGCGNLCMELVA
jgi:N-methylhydantoinase A